MMTRRQLADNIDDLDAKITELQREKSEFYAAYREQIAKTEPPEKVKLELAACKAAIRHRQKLIKDRDAVEEKDDLTASILDEITKPGTPVATRARAAREEPKSAPPKSLVVLGPGHPEPDLTLPDFLDRSKAEASA